MVFPALAEEGDDGGRGVEPVNDEGAVAADPFEAFARGAFRGGLGAVQTERPRFLRQRRCC